MVMYVDERCILIVDSVQIIEPRVSECPPDTRLDRITLNEPLSNLTELSPSLPYPFPTVAPYIKTPLYPRSTSPS